MNCSGNNNTCWRKGKGRQKVEMVKIQNEKNLQVTFSKRRVGLFKKASELSTLCAAETIVVVFSPANKPHSFAHPDLETVATRFLRLQNVPETMSNKLHQRANLNQQTLELSHLHRQLELERKRAQELETQRLRCRPDLDKLDYTKLARLQKALQQFKDQFEIRVCSAARLGHSSLLGPVSSTERAGCRPSFDTPMVGDSSILIPYSSTSPTHIDHN